MFPSFNEYFNFTSLLGIVSIIIGLIMLGLLLWVSILDIKYKKVAFWKLLIAGFAIIMEPTLFHLTHSNWSLSFYLLGSIILFAFIIFLNLMFNNQKFVGKADIDILAAPISITAMYSLYLNFEGGDFANLGILYIWYQLVQIMAVGLVGVFALYIIFALIRNALKGEFSVVKLFVFMKGAKIPVVPMLVPACVLMPLMIALTTAVPA